MKHLETFLKLIIIGILTALVRTYIQGFIPMVEEPLLWPSIFVEGGITPLAYLVFGSVFYTVVAALYLMLDKKMGGRKILKGLKFSFLLIIIWVPYLWEPLPHVTTMDKFLYPLADGGALLVMGILLGIFVATDRRKKSEDKVAAVDEKGQGEVLNGEISNLVDNILELEEESGEEEETEDINEVNEEREIKEASIARRSQVVKKSYPAKKKTYAPKKKSSGKKGSKAKNKSKGKKNSGGNVATAGKKVATPNKVVALDKASVPSKNYATSKNKNTAAKNKNTTARTKDNIEKMVVVDKSTAGNRIMTAENHKDHKAGKVKFSFLNVMIIGLIFFIGRIAMYKFLRLYSSFGTKAVENLLWILVTGLVIGVVYELTTPYIVTSKKYLRFLIFGALFLAVNLVALNGFKPLIFRMDVADLAMRTAGDVVLVLLGGACCTLFDRKK